MISTSAVRRPDTTSRDLAQRDLDDRARRSAQPDEDADFEAVAPKGIGVFDTLKAVAKLV